MIHSYVTDIQAHTKKSVKTLRDKLQGMAYVNPEYKYVLKAFLVAQEFHSTRTRKDGVTPEFLHPVQATLHLLTLGPLIEPVVALGGLIIHDYPEDSGMSDAAMFAHLNEKIGHSGIVNAGMNFSKITDGKKMDNQTYYDILASSPSLSLGKGCDRCNNMGTMGCMPAEKQLAQAQETVDFVIPMLKVAQRRFLEQEAAYENLKLILWNQVNLVRAAHGN